MLTCVYGCGSGPRPAVSRDLAGLGQRGALAVAAVLNLGVVAVVRGRDRACVLPASYRAQRSTGGPCRDSRPGDIWVIIAYAVWAFIYFAYSWAASGRTAGMTLFGVRVVRDDGTDVSGRRAVVRTLSLPLSFLFLGLGFTGILLGDRRRALHDVIAGTAVIYS